MQDLINILISLLLKPALRIIPHKGEREGGLGPRNWEETSGSQDIDGNLVAQRQERRQNFE
jgi:hypothetical protein